jgi:hypothetical protein
MAFSAFSPSPCAPAVCHAHPPLHAPHRPHILPPTSYAAATATATILTNIPRTAALSIHPTYLTASPSSNPATAPHDSSSPGLLLRLTLNRPSSPASSSPAPTPVPQSYDKEDEDMMEWIPDMSPVQSELASWGIFPMRKILSDASRTRI